MRLANLLIPCLIALPLGAQGTRADYERMARMEDLLKAETARMRVEPTWMPDNASFWYRRNLPGDAREWVFVAARDGARRPAFDHARLARELSRELGRPVSADHLPLEHVDFTAAAGHLRFSTEEGWWDLDLRSGKLGKGRPPKDFAQASRDPDDDPAPTRTDRPQPSPDGRYVAQLEDANIVVRSTTGREVFRTRDGVASNPYTGALEWSPDSRKFVAQRATVVPIHRVTFVESSPKDQVEPKVHVNDYAKPGDPLPEVRPTLVNLETGQAHPRTPPSPRPPSTDTERTSRSIGPRIPAASSSSTTSAATRCSGSSPATRPRGRRRSWWTSAAPPSWTTRASSTSATWTPRTNWSG